MSPDTSNIRIPILLNHQHDRIIGWMSERRNVLLVEFLPGEQRTSEQIFEIFSGAGLTVLDQEIVQDPHTGKQSIFIRRFEILEFSFVATPLPKLGSTEG